jgi:putative membrane protein
MMPMGPEYFWWGGIMWIFPIILLIVILIAIFLIFGRRGVGPSCWHGTKESETPLEILKKRYAKGEITKEEYEQIKKDIMS